jgi:hypothetical protein
MKQKLLFLILLVTVGGTAIAQAPQLAKVTPPSPNAAAFQKYGDIPISPYTGIPNISIPIYTIKFRDISIPISLSYQASGIKVSEEASQVGLGWAINTGGMISRNIIGDDDFYGWAYFNNYANNLEDLTYNHGPTNLIVNGCSLPRFNRNIPQNPTLDTIDLLNQLSASPGYDFQPDQYFYNFLGQSGKFTLKRNRQAALQKAEKIEITCLDTLGNAFQVRDLNGFIYDFAQFETVHEGSQFRHTAWYLTKVASPSGNSVTYKYSVISDRIYTLGSYSITREDWNTPGIFANAILNPNAQPTQQGVSPPKLYSHVQLDTIDFNTGIVKFSYSDRTDVDGDKKLDSVSVYTKNEQGTISATPLKTIALSHSYFDYGAFDNDFSSDTSYGSKRLKLTQVLEKGYYGGNLVSANPYKFTYYEGGSLNLPSKNSFAKDHWGYYNGRTSNTSLIPSFVSISSPDLITSITGGQGTEREPDGSVMKAFSLASIEYPTGGSTELQYEANDFDEKLSQVNDNSYFGKKYSIVEQEQTITYDNINKHFSGTDTLDLRNEYLYTNNLGQVSSYHVKLSAIFRFGNPTTDCSRTFQQGTITFDIYDSSGTTNLITKDIANFANCSGTTNTSCMYCGSGVFTYVTELSLPPAKYVIRFNASSIYNNALQDVRWRFKYYTQQSIPATYSTGTTYLTGGGLRIKRIIDHDAFNTANDKVKKFVYHYWADLNNDGIQEEYSFGKRMSRPSYQFFDVSYEHFEDCSQGTPCRQWYFFSSRLMRCSESNNPLNGSAGGAVVGYDQVTVLDGENGENGKTVYNYTNEPDFISPYNEPYNNLPMRPPFASSIPEQLNGSLIKQVDYASNGQKVKEVLNTYTSTMDNENTIYGMEPRKYLKFITQLPNSGSSSTDNALPCDLLLISYWHQKSVWNYLASTDQKIYAQGDTTKYQQLTTNYFYEDTAHLLPTRIVTANSKSEIITERTTYPLSYSTLTASDALTQGVLNLKNKHVISAPVEKYVQKANSDGSNVRVTSGLITAYGSSMPLPILAYTTETLSPITAFSALNISSSGASLDTRYKPIIYFDGYDTYGNIVQQHKENDNPMAYIWDYKASLPIAECANAASNEIAYTSFEFDGTGNWTIGSTSRNTTDAMTGKKSYVLSNGSITKAISNTSKAYVVSFWSKTGSVTVNSSSAATALIRNGWTYNEITLTSGISSIIISGSATIDELRLYPSTGQMNSYTHEPLVGLTTQTDISYYEYDGLGRLMLIRDMNGNIVKTFNYHFKTN